MTPTTTRTTYFRPGRSKRQPHLLWDGHSLLHPTCVHILIGDEDLDSADSGYLWGWWKAFGKQLVKDRPELMRRRPRRIVPNHTDPDVRAIYRAWFEQCSTDPIECWCGDDATYSLPADEDAA